MRIKEQETRLTLEEHDDDDDDDDDLINGTIFGKHLLKLKCVFSFAILLSKAFLILRIPRDVTVNVRTSSCEVVDLSDFHET